MTTIARSLHQQKSQPPPQPLPPQHLSSFFPLPTHSIFPHNSPRMHFPSDALIYYQMIFIRQLSQFSCFFLSCWPLTPKYATKALTDQSHTSIVCIAHDFQKGPTDYLFVHKNCFVRSRSWHCNSHHSSLFTGPSRQCNME